MLDSLGDHEFYCASYAGKEQPHIEGLLQTLMNGVRSLDQEMAARIDRQEPVQPLERAKRLLNRLTLHCLSTGCDVKCAYPQGDPLTNEVGKIRKDGLLEPILPLGKRVILIPIFVRLWWPDMAGAR